VAHLLALVLVEIEPGHGLLVLDEPDDVPPELVEDRVDERLARGVGLDEQPDRGGAESRTCSVTARSSLSSSPSRRQPSRRASRTPRCRASSRTTPSSAAEDTATASPPSPEGSRLARRSSDSPVSGPLRVAGSGPRSC
jgi:hypothetical protein